MSLALGREHSWAWRQAHECSPFVGSGSRSLLGVKTYLFACMVILMARWLFSSENSWACRWEARRTDISVLSVCRIRKSKSSLDATARCSAASREMIPGTYVLFNPTRTLQLYTTNTHPEPHDEHDPSRALPLFGPQQPDLHDPSRALPLSGPEP